MKSTSGEMLRCAFRVFKKAKDDLMSSSKRVSSSDSLYKSRDRMSEDNSVMESKACSLTSLDVEL